MLRPARRPSSRLMCVALALALGPLDSRAGIPPALRSLLVTRVLLYDRALPARANGAVRIAVVHGADAASVLEAEQTLQGLRGLQRLGRSAQTLEVSLVNVGDGTRFANDLTRLRPAALYLCEGLGSDTATALLALSRSLQSLTFGDRDAYAEVAIGLGTSGARASIRVQLAQARAEGARLDAALLALAEVKP